MDHADPSPAELQQYLDVELDDLFATLAPRDPSVAYSRRGLVARGKQHFHELLSTVRAQLCAAYHLHPERIVSAVDLAALVVAVVQSRSALVGPPLCAFAAIVARLGISEVCGQAGIRR